MKSILDKVAVPVKGDLLPDVHKHIDACFSADTVEGIITRLGMGVDTCSLRTSVLVADVGRGP